MKVNIFKKILILAIILILSGCSQPVTNEIIEENLGAADTASDAANKKVDGIASDLMMDDLRMIHGTLLQNSHEKVLGSSLLLL